MSKFIRKQRLKDAILGLSDWRGKVQSQTSQHLFPFLALVRKANGLRENVRYEESDDFDFYDSFMATGISEQTPYFDPLTRQYRIKTHPHSNVATSRKGTFELKWKAVTSVQKDGQNYLTFSPDAAEILAERAFTRSNKKTRVNVLDLAVWLYRDAEFEDADTSEDVRKRFRDEFKMSDAEFDMLFEFVPEPDASLFAPTKLSGAEISAVVQELELSSSPKLVAPKVGSGLTHGEAKEVSALDEDDAVLADVRAILRLGSSGVVFRGAPGTGKSWYAMQIALNLVEGDASRVRRVQFHPSYGYEDFVEGFVPNESSVSGFSVADKFLLDAIEHAKKTDKPVIIIVDEINRGDTARIFGELLTYIEHGWRDVPFTLRLSGRQISIPRNLILLATMNPHDRSITQLDMALLRRFDQVDIAPSRETAANFLLSAGFGAEGANIISAWFEELQGLLPFGIGHAFFKDVGDIGSLGIMWRYRLLPFCESILEFERERLQDVIRSYEALIAKLRNVVEDVPSA